MEKELIKEKIEEEKFRVLTNLFKTYTYLELFEFLCLNQYIDYSITELERMTKISRPTLYQILKDFEKWEIVNKIEKRYIYGESDLAKQLSGSFLVVALAAQEKINMT